MSYHVSSFPAEPKSVPWYVWSFFWCLSDDAAHWLNLLPRVLIWSSIDEREPGAPLFAMFTLCWEHCCPMKHFLVLDSIAVKWGWVGIGYSEKLAWAKWLQRLWSVAWRKGTSMTPTQTLEQWRCLPWLVVLYNYYTWSDQPNLQSSLGDQTKMDVLRWSKWSFCSLPKGKPQQAL